MGHWNSNGQNYSENSSKMSKIFQNLISRIFWGWVQSNLVKHPPNPPLFSSRGASPPNPLFNIFTNNIWYKYRKGGHELLSNHKKWKSFNSFSEKGMNTGLIKIAVDYSLMSILVNRQSFLAIVILHWDLETIFWKFLWNFGPFSHNLAQKKYFL